MAAEGEKAPVPAKGPGLLETLAQHSGPLTAIAETVGRIVDGYVTQRETHARAVAEQRARFVGRIILVMSVLFGLAVVVTGILAVLGVVSGEGFAFLVGVLIGSLLTFLSERIAPFLYDSGGGTED